MLQYPKACQFRRAQLIVKVVAQLARLDGHRWRVFMPMLAAKALCVMPFALSSATNVSRSHLPNRFEDRPGFGWPRARPAGLPGRLRGFQERVRQRFAMVARAGFADMAATAGRHATCCGLYRHDVGAMVAFNLGDDLRSDACGFEEPTHVAFGLLTGCSTPVGTDCGLECFYV